MQLNIPLAIDIVLQAQLQADQDRELRKKKRKATGVKQAHAPSDARNDTGKGSKNDTTSHSQDKQPARSTKGTASGRKITASSRPQAQVGACLPNTAGLEVRKLRAH